MDRFASTTVVRFAFVGAKLHGTGAGVNSEMYLPGVLIALGARRDGLAALGASSGFALLGSNAALRAAQFELFGRPVRS